MSGRKTLAREIAARTKPASSRLNGLTHYQQAFCAFEENDTNRLRGASGSTAKIT